MVCKRAILAPLNVEVDAINDQVLEMFPSEQKCYKSIDCAEKDNKTKAPNFVSFGIFAIIKASGYDL
jgi:hypothetical protein